MTDLRSASYSFVIDDTTQYPRFVIHVGKAIEKSSVSASCSNTNDGIAIATGNGSGPWDYEWRDEQGNILQNNTGIAGSDSLFNASPGIYTVTVTGNSGSCAVLADTVVITSPAPLTFSATPASESCAGTNDGSVMLNAVNGGTMPFAYSWSNGMTSANIDSLSPGTYTLTVTDNNGCTRTDSVIVSPGITVIASSSAIEDTVYLVFGGDAAFSNGSTGASFYVWDFNDGSPADSTINPSHVYTSTGVYNVMLVAGNGSCSDTSYTQVTVLNEPLSLDEIAAGISMHLLDNAGSISLSIELDEPSDITLTLYNTLGQQLGMQEFSDVRSTVVPLSTPRTAGIYLIKVTAGDKQITRKFFYGN
jgi:PKD repeat protein